ncbi:hypothetical protein ENBRE01_1792 [Enteropsectra breve]|nr:hypothetical protein ENBRE01_1792 [Enteropsectra breve]
MYGFRLSACLLALRLIPAIAGEIRKKAYIPLDFTFIGYDFSEPQNVSVTLSKLKDESDMCREYTLVVTGQYRGWEPVVLGEDVYFGGEGYSTEPLKNLAKKNTPLIIKVLYPNVNEICSYTFLPQGDEFVLKRHDRHLNSNDSSLWTSGKDGKELKMLDSMPLDLKYLKNEFPESNEVSVSLSTTKDSSGPSRLYIFIVTGKYMGWEPKVKGLRLTFGSDERLTEPIDMFSITKETISLTIKVLYPDVEETCFYYYKPINGRMILDSKERRKDSIDMEMVNLLNKSQPLRLLNFTQLPQEIPYDQF